MTLLDSALMSYTRINTVVYELSGYAIVVIGTFLSKLVNGATYTGCN